MSRVAYLDSSALTKLVRLEPESDPLRAFLNDVPNQATSRIAVVEVSRAIRRAELDAADRIRSLFADIVILEIDERIADAASRIGPPALRALDAIHLATAIELTPDLAALITYDRRLADASRLLGVPVASPA